MQTDLFVDALVYSDITSVYVTEDDKRVFRSGYFMGSR